MTRQDKYNRGRLFRLLDYLRDRLSGRERNAMERQFQRDPFEADAVEGLSMLGEEEIAEDLARIRERIQNRIRRRRRIAFYSAAAAIASLLIVGTIFLNIEPGADQRARSDKMARKAVETPARQHSGGQSPESPATPSGKAEQQETDESRETATAQPGEEAAGVPVEKETTGMQTKRGDEPAGQPAEEVLGATAEESAEEPTGEPVEQPSGAIEFDEETYDYDLSATQQPEVTGVSEGTDTGESTGEEPGPDSQPEETTRKKVSPLKESITVEEEAEKAARDEEITYGEVVEKTYSQTGSVATVAPESGEKDYRDPTPVMGMPDYRDYLAEEMEFPGEAQTDRAVVVLNFMVTLQGRPAEIEVVRSPGESFSREAIRLVEDGPDWIPASRDGEYTNTSVRLRVVFTR